ncbi:MAG: sporulation integral membrane protein YlbJ [Clostridia bacterium]|nr:sporulation integral membrane protein YlbJ [Clostridia bacterium]
MKFFIFFKRNLISFSFVLFVFLLVAFSNSTFYATKNGLTLWANSVVPSLFPFLVAVELLNHTSVVYYLSVLLDKYMKPLFNLPGISAYPFIMGLLSGYPIGAKIVCDLYDNDFCTKEEAERMLSFTNNSGPLFIIGTVGISFYSNSTIGIILLITHVLASITVGIVTGIFSKSGNTIYRNKNLGNIHNSADISVSNLGEILGLAIINSIKNILVIGGFVTLFSVITTLLEKTHCISIVSNTISSISKLDSSIVSSFISGIVEFTNGLSKLSSIHIKNISLIFVLSAFIIGFGGISVSLQVLSIISKHNLSIKKYLLGKLMQATLAGLYTFLILLIPIFNFDI